LGSVAIFSPLVQWLRGALGLHEISTALFNAEALTPLSAHLTRARILTIPKINMSVATNCAPGAGYHDNVGKVYYAVMPYPTCDGCLGGKQVFDALTGTSTHELCEAITDAVPGAGWYDDNNGEIGDICAWNFKQVAGYNVQLEWSNNANKCV